MKAFLKFNRGVLKMPLGWKLWLILLVSFNLVVPLTFFIDRLEAQIVVASMLVSVVLMTILTALSGFSRLVGLGHILWIPMIIFLWIRLDAIPTSDSYGVWIRILIGLNAASLLLDGIDVRRYICGDRKETVAGL
jgi:hypothetical protein